MLETCKLSREIALSVFEPRIQLYTSEDKVLCTTPNTGLESAKRIHIYTKTRHSDIEIRVGSEVCSVINWIHSTLGFQIIELSEFEITARYLATWPLEEGDRLDNAVLLQSRLPVYEGTRRSLPLRLQGMRFFTPRNTSRDKRNRR
jgi:hypothetical protein